MSLADHLQCYNPVINTVKRQLQTVLSKGALDLDQLVVLSRVPVRTALIVLDGLLKSGDVEASNGIFSAFSNASSHQASQIQAPHLSELVPPDLAEAYSSLAKDREEPVLMWSQRRLLPWSAIERAGFIRRNVGSMEKLIFFGDDDFVSPLVSALQKDTDVHVVDLDADLLDRISAAATRLGGAVTTHHCDVSAFAADYCEDAADAVVSDPFPTGDAGFEKMFWQSTNRVLKMGGLNISTISASHKPVGFERSAIRAIDEAGFIITHLEANLGKYEIFDFEFCAYEHEILDRAAAKATISQTKSVF